MICVSIGRGRHKQMIAEHRHLAEQGAELVELRIDYIRREINYRRLLEKRPCPVVITCRRERDGGKWVGDEATRRMLLRSAIATGVEFVDLEEDVAAEIPRYGTTKRIISYHNFRETPDDIGSLHDRMMELDPDIIKIATMGHTPYDIVRLLRLSKQSPIPTVAMCMGEIGTPSRILAGRFSTPFTYATFHHERTLAPGQLSFRQMRDVYHYDEINETTEVFGVVADPVSHSFSPIIHNAAFRAMNMNRVYVPFRVPREDIDEFLMDCRELGVKGLSVTIPHKERVVNRLTNADFTVGEIGACNTIVLQGKDEMLGYNTDFRAAMDTLDEAAGRTEEENPFKKETALVLGAGGVAKTVVYGLLRREADVVVASRNFAKARELAVSMKCQAIDWELRHDAKPKVLVNCTPVGMHPNVDESPFDRKHLRRGMVVFDTVYNPQQTLLLKQAREKQCKIVSGVDMFLGQAAMQFKLFTDKDAPPESMRKAFSTAISPFGRG